MHGLSTSGYLLTCDYHQYNTSGMSVANNVGVPVGILFLTSFRLLTLNKKIEVTSRDAGIFVDLKF